MGPGRSVGLSNSKYLEMFRELSDILVVGVHFNDFIKAAVERGLYDTGGESVASFAARRLADLGCEEAQGYLFCRPSPPGEFAAWDRAQRKQTTSVPEIAPT